MKKKDKPSISIMIPKEKHAVGAPSSFYSFFYPFCFCFGSLFQSFTHDFFCCFGLQNCTNTWIIFLLFNDFTKNQKTSCPFSCYCTSLCLYSLFIQKTLFYTGKFLFAQASDTFSGGIFKCLCNSSKKNRFEFSFSCSHLSFFTPAFAVATI